MLSPSLGRAVELTRATPDGAHARRTTPDRLVHQTG